MRSGIRISVNLSDYFGKEISRVCYDLEDIYAREALQPVDRFNPDSDVLSKMLCTPKKDQERIDQMRRDLAERISKEMEQSLLEAMGINDTRNGYTADQDQIWFGKDGMPVRVPSDNERGKL